MCNKCRQLHSDLFDNHKLIDINQKKMTIFTGKCKKKIIF